MKEKDLICYEEAFTVIQVRNFQDKLNNFQVDFIAEKLWLFWTFKNICTFATEENIAVWSLI